MKVLVTGASGMVGAGVLRECLLAADVEQVIALGRAPSGVTDAKLRDLVCADLFDLGAIEHELAGVDACFFCLGVSSSGLDEAAYTRLTYDLTLAVARALVRVAPAAVFVYVSGAGTDEHSGAMWRRVKGRTESDLRALPFRAVYAFRPGIIVPRNGARSRTPLYRAFYIAAAPVTAVARLVAPARVVTTETMGRAMLALARRPAGAPSAILEAADIAATGNAP